MTNSLQGKFKPRNPEKYHGDPTNIVFRSSWEQSMMNYLDLREDVQTWQSEEKFVVYYDPITKKNRRYFPDFIVKFKNSKGEIVVEMIEVKPWSQVIGPNPTPKRRTKSWVIQVQTHMTNLAKWEAAKNYCKERNWTFKILTEKDIPAWDKSRSSS